MLKKITVTSFIIIICSSFLFSFSPKKLFSGKKIGPFLQGVIGKNYIGNFTELSNKPADLSEQKIDQLIAEIKQSRHLIKTIYLPWPAEKLTTSETTTMLKKFHRENIKVFYLINETELLSAPEETSQLISALLIYNEEQLLLNKDLFDGIVFDLKPYLHPAWQNQPEKLLSSLLEILQNSKKLIAGRNSTIPVAVSFPYTFGLNSKTEQDFFYQAFNYINIINIYPFANEVSDIFQNIEWLTTYATETKTIFNIGLFLKPLPDQTLSYYKANPNFFNYSLSEIEKKFKKNKNFNTFIFNDLADLNSFDTSLTPTAPDNIRIVSLETILRPATPNQEAALLSVYQKDQYLYLQFSVSDDNYISTTKGLRENKITDDHLLITFSAYPGAGYPKQGTLSFKASAGNKEENIPPYLSAVKPHYTDFSNWVISSEIAENHYKLFLTIPLKELFFNLKKENYLYFQFEIHNQKTVNDQEKYLSEPFLFLFSPDNND